MQLIDLSQPIINGMPVFPGDENVSIQQTKTLKKDHYNLACFTSGMHAGTHIDLPNHFLEDKRTAVEFPLENFIGRGVLLDVRGENTIEYKPHYESMIQKDNIVLLYTDFASLYSEPKKYYSDYPILSNNITDFLIKKKIKMLGMDTPAPDKTPFNTHKMFLMNDILILENLTNLGELQNIDSFEISAVPLKIQAEASLVRAYARILGCER